MAREIPEVVRAAAGLAATVLDEARKLPETLPGLPVRLIGLAMQHAMKVQQQYAGLVARGDELFTGLRGEDEPGLATFDDDEDDVVQPASTGFRESAFDRAGDAEPTSASIDLILDAEVAAAQEAPDADAILDEIAIDELVDQAPTLQETAPSPAASAPAKAAKKAAKAPAKAAKSAAKAAKAAKATPQGPAKAAPAAKPRKTATPSRPAEDAARTEDAAAQETALLEAALAAPATSDAGSPATDAQATPSTDTDTAAAPAPTAADTLDAEPTADVATTADVLTPAGDVATVEATVTDEGVAAPETTEPAAPETAEPTAPETSEPAATPTTTATEDTATSSAPRNAPVDGYDSFSVAQLRGRLRGYALTTVQDLVSYEQATRARAPYLTMLRNRLEKLEEQAIESSPLAPRGA